VVGQSTISALPGRIAWPATSNARAPNISCSFPSGRMQIRIPLSYVPPGRNSHISVPQR
jgi:hypothetical protein